MADIVILHRENVMGGNKAIYPYTNEYNEPTREGCQFYGWKYNNTVYTPQQYATQEQNPFGPITEDTQIMAIWNRIFVYCVRTPNETVPYEGGDAIITYYAVVGNQIINSNEVTLHVDDTSTDASYTRGSDVVSGNFRTCNFTFAQNTSHDGKYLTVYAKYKDVESEKLAIYQTNPYETVIPDSDYFLFTYEWNDTDGRDLDSLTVITVYDENNQIKQTSFSGIPIGYRGSASGVESNGSVYKVYSENELLCLRHSEDNTQSGAEGAVICLTNIANSGEISALDKIHIDIYANWYAEKLNGEMRIVCMGYKHKSKQTPADYDTDIIETLNLVGPTSSRKYYSFSPNTDNCEINWNPESQQRLSVEAYGIPNAIFENAFIPYLGNLYSHIATVTYDIGKNIKTYKIREEDKGIDRELHSLRFKGECTEGAESAALISPTIYGINISDNGQDNVVIDNIYFDFFSEAGSELATWDADKFMFTNNDDYIKVSFYREDKGTDFVIKKENLGTTYDESYLNEFIVTQNETTKKIKIKFKITPANNKTRNVDLTFGKVSADGYHPFETCKINIWQNH